MRTLPAASRSSPLVADRVSRSYLTLIKITNFRMPGLSIFKRGDRQHSKRAVVDGERFLSSVPAAGILTKLGNHQRRRRRWPTRLDRRARSSPTDRRREELSLDGVERIRV